MVDSPLRIDPWVLVEDPVDLDRLGLTETLLAVANGAIGMRGSLEEGAPAHRPGVFVAGLHERFHLSYPERGYGDPEQGQALVNAPDGLRVRLLVDDEPLDVRTGQVRHHRRTLDLRDGVLERELGWTSPAGRRVDVRTGRLASLEHRCLAALAHEVVCVDEPVRVTLVSELVANDTAPVVENADPRVAEALERPYVGRWRTGTPTGGVLVHATRASGLEVGAGCDHVAVVTRSDGREARLDPHVDVDEDAIRCTWSVDLQPGERLRVEKVLALTRGRDLPPSALGADVAGHLETGRGEGWDGLRAGNRRRLGEFWAVARVDVPGDPQLEASLRHALFQTYQSTALVEDAPVGAKGLTGGGYSGHTFWDIEGFVVPALTLLAPGAAEALLRWRAETVDVARARAEELGLRGAAFPWRTVDGHEASGYWPASTAAMHVQADIARAMDLYRHVRGEEEFERVHGVVVLVETARLWVALGHHDRDGRWHLFGLTGPDEYTAVVDDNVFTNLMAARNLRAAVQACGRHPERAADLGVGEDELEAWSRAAGSVHVPWDDELGVHPSATGFTDYPEWDFSTWGDRYPVQDHAPYAQIYRRQVVKQADLVHALWWCGDDFTPEQVARDLAYYEPRTVRDSSLSAAIQAVVAVQAGHTALGLDYLREAASVDLWDLQGNAELGAHLASLAGAWLALVAGMGGLREDAEQPQLSPRLPEGLDGYSFGFRWRDSILRVTVGTDVRVSVQGDGPLDVVIYGEEVRISPGRPAVAPLRSARPLGPTPTQPPGRSPREILEGRG